ncbi:rRNA methyltransferase [Aquibacillus koreensis]|uniref:rRNA methyltransferase n=1 Tax=Aquibacillus koreensis TaxID=279446 RepID=A0A9X4AJ44_9BACI|nr:rRNA methyltransferase [Aquibacillus koreensis]MCT2536274.1 rRNA methyltransferase [Aquibacillus koreensis]MDC3421374.1 rRNA methyltransferase [Aquibacillus koreensis]
MWKLVNGNLIQTTDESRVKFRTNISKAIIEHLNELAKQHYTHPNYLLESGLQQVLAQGVIDYNKKNRPKDRIQYKTTYDKELLDQVKAFAKEHSLFINDVIEYSVEHIDFNNIKKSGHKHRIEKA